jgi:hypothetical protein
MLPHAARSILLLALSTLSLALPQPQSAPTAQAINPINGLPLPGANSDSASALPPTLIANYPSSPSSSPSSDDADSSSSTASDLTTITASATLSAATDSSSGPSSSDQPPNTDPNVIIWTDTAENTIYTVTRSTTSSIPIPTMGVPPPSSDAATATIMGPDGKPTTTSDVTTFVQGYTGAGGRVEVTEERVWWVVLVGVAAGFGVVVL